MAIEASNGKMTDNRRQSHSNQLSLCRQTSYSTSRESWSMPIISLPLEIMAEQYSIQDTLL
jgi:hypothetical protein